MSSLNAIRVAYEPLREIVFGDIPAAYGINNLVNANSTFYIPALNPIREIKIKNTTDSNVYISYSQPTLTGVGMVSMDYIPAHSGDVSDYCSNKAEPAGVFEQSLGTNFSIIYDTTAPQVAPTQGKVTITVIYASMV